jgi:hypothetical protein
MEPQSPVPGRNDVLADRHAFCWDCRMDSTSTLMSAGSYLALPRTRVQGSPASEAEGVRTASQCLQEGNVTGQKGHTWLVE